MDGSRPSRSLLEVRMARTTHRPLGRGRRGAGESQRRAEKRYRLDHASHVRQSAARTGEPGRGCKDKRQILDEETATHAAQEMGRLYGEEFREYFCERCGYWHVGHAGKPRREKEWMRAA
jgi:hypothetical protein